MRRALSVTLVLVVLLSALAFPVSARLEFCSTDPIYNVDGREVSVVIDLAPYELKDQITWDNPVVTVLSAPRGTNPYVVSVTGDFPEVALAREWKPRVVGIAVRVPRLEDFQMMRVTVYVDGQMVRQVQTGHRFAFVAVPWR